jgi:hypothetical protein
MPTSPSEALVTGDGVLTGMSDICDTNELYRSDARMIRIEIPLTMQEFNLAEQIVEDKIRGSIQYSIRSFLAQIGLHGFEASTTEPSVHFSTLTLRVDTLITDVAERAQSKVLKTLRLLANGKHAPVVRAVLVPEAAVQYSGITFDEAGMPMKKPQTVDIALENMHYEFPGLTSENIRIMIETRASGRRLLGQYRVEKEGIPTHLPPGGFFVGKIKVDHPTHHLFLNEETVFNGGTCRNLLHSCSPLIDARRPEPDRQVEIANVNGAPEPLEGRFVRAKVYRAAQNQEETL